MTTAHPLRFGIVVAQRAAWPELATRAREVEDLGFDLIDLNLGCPAITWSDQSFEGRHKVQIDQSLCIGCTLCAQVCTVDCIKTVAPVTQ